MDYNVSISFTGGETIFKMVDTPTDEVLIDVIKDVAKKEYGGVVSVQKCCVEALDDFKYRDNYCYLPFAITYKGMIIIQGFVRIYSDVMEIA